MNSLQTLTDVNISSLQNNNILQFNSISNKWNNVSNSADILTSGLTNKFVNDILNTKADILVHNGLSVQKLGVGNDGEVLTADSSVSTGIKWNSPITSLINLNDVSINSVQDKSLLQYDININKWINISNSADNIISGSINKFITSILNTKGDIPVHNGLSVQKFGIGSDNQILMSDSTHSTGIKWGDFNLDSLMNISISNPQNNDILQYKEISGHWINVVNSADNLVPGSTNKFVNDIVYQKGDIIVCDGVKARRIQVGNDGSVLTANSECPLGVQWTTNSALTNIAELTDVSINNLEHGHILQYNSIMNKWTNVSKINISINTDNIFDGEVNRFVTSILTTKGDLAIRNSTTVQRLPIGSDGQILIVNSSEASGVQWIDKSMVSSYFKNNSNILNISDILLHSIPQNLYYNTLNNFTLSPSNMQATYTGTIISNFNINVSLLVSSNNTYDAYIVILINDIVSSSRGLIRGSVGRTSGTLNIIKTLTPNDIIEVKIAQFDANSSIYTIIDGSLVISQL